MPRLFVLRRERAPDERRDAEQREELRGDGLPHQVFGLTAAIGIGSVAESQLYQIKGRDATVLVVSAVLLTLVALGSGLIPAHRASKVDPMRALRYE